MEPELNFSGVLYSPSSGIIDPHDLMLAYLGDAEDHGAALALSRHLKGHATATAQPEASTAPLALFPGDAQPKEEVKGGNDNGNGHTSINKSRCPDCSVGTLVFQEGCARCMECGYTKCE